MSEDRAAKVAEEINDAMSNWMASKDDKRSAPQVITDAVRPHLSTPAAGPGLDAAEFVWKCLGEHPANAPKLVAELRAALPPAPTNKETE